MKIPMNRVIKSRNMRRAGHVAGKGERTYRVLVGGGEGKGNRLLGRRRYTWESNIKKGIQGIDWREGWIGLIWLRIWTRWPALVESSEEPSGSYKMLGIS